MPSPRKKRITTEEFIEEDNHREVPLDDPRILAGDDTLDYALKQFDDRQGLELKYYLTQPGGSAFIGGYSDIIQESQLQDWYPQGGKFEVRIYVHGEFRDRRFMMIAPRPGGMGSSGDGSSGNLEVRLLREQLQMMREEMRSRNNQPQSSASELAQAVAALQQVAGNNNQNNPVETVKLAMELAKMIKGVPEGDDSFMGVVKDVVKEAGPSLLQSFMAKNGNPPAVPVAVLPASVVTPEQRLQQSLKDGIAFLKKKAVAGADAGLYIDFAIDNREGELFAPILHAILTQEFSVFTSIDPEIGQPPYVEWFRTLYDGLRSAFAPADPVVISGVGKAGNDANPTGDAKPRKAGSK